MTKNKKILVAIFGSLFLVAILAVGGGYWFYKVKLPEYMNEAQALENEARDFGRNADEQACLERALAYAKTEQGQTFRGAIGNTAGLKACLQASRPLAGFCEHVPVTNVLEMIAWQSDLCGDDNEYCSKMLREVPKYCVSSVREAKLARLGAAPGGATPAAGSAPDPDPASAK